MTFTRAQRLEQILALKAEGLTSRQVAKRLGMKVSGVRNITNDPDGSKQAARHRRYAGECANCGAPTSGSNGSEKAPTMCKACARGETPSLPSLRRCLPVRLVDVPVDVRLEAAREACRREPEDAKRTEILFAALFPSDQTYWVADGARAKLDEIGVAA